MRIFRLRTVRAKLIATTLLVVAALLALLGVLVSTTSHQALITSTDGDLERRGLEFVNTIAARLHRGVVPPLVGPFRPRRQRDPEWIAPALIPLSPRPGQPGPRDLAYDYQAFTEAAKGEQNFKTDVVGGDPRRLFSVPAREHGQVVAVVQVASSLAPAMSAWRSQRDILLRVILPLGLILGSLASLFVVNRLLKPLRHLTTEAERIGEAGFGERLVPQGEDEFASLVGTLNGMLQRLEAHYRLEHQTNRSLQATLDQQRRFTSDASHELKTPLSVIKAHVGILKNSRATVAEEMESIRAIDAGTSRMAYLIRDLLVLARTDSTNTVPGTPCRIEDIIEKAVYSVPGGSERTEFRSGDHACVLGAEDELVRVFINLIENAIKHSGSPRPIELELSVAERSITVFVRDNGVGIAAEHLPHLFERFYRADPSRASDTGGSGLGLAICDQIVRRHGGEITVDSEVGHGACFAVRLPRSECPAA